MLGELESHHQWLLKGGVVTQDVIDTWSEYKRIEEHDAVALRPPPLRVRLGLRQLVHRGLDGDSVREANMGGRVVKVRPSFRLIDGPRCMILLGTTPYSQGRPRDSQAG